VINAYTYMGDNGGEVERIFNEVEKQASYNRPEGIATEISGVPAVQQRLSSMVEKRKTLQQ